MLGPLDGATATREVVGPIGAGEGEVGLRVERHEETGGIAELLAVGVAIAVGVEERERRPVDVAFFADVEVGRQIGRVVFAEEEVLAGVASHHRQPRERVAEMAHVTLELVAARHLVDAVATRVRGRGETDRERDDDDVLLESHGIHRLPKAGVDASGERAATRPAGVAAGRRAITRR
ncbi:MAG: hypothetical protein H6701_15790 [Myxococcales bacterium]|nr:hypothetical protein [Myxococcales bacterium]MCB9552761.1 hypothetical protein [Myxococcales bacterium]